MDFLYKPITFWQDAYHVFDGETKIGMVNRRLLRDKRGQERSIWMAHNIHFFSIEGYFESRSEAAMAIPRGKIHQSVGAISRSGAFS